MKTLLSLTAITALALTLLASPAMLRDSLAEEPEYLLGRFVVCMKIRDREPLGITDTFGRDTSKVYAFIEMTDVAKETNVKVQWLFEGKETVAVSGCLLFAYSVGACASPLLASGLMTLVKSPFGLFAFWCLVNASLALVALYLLKREKVEVVAVEEPTQAPWCRIGQTRRREPSNLEWTTAWFDRK